MKTNIFILVVFCLIVGIISAQYSMWNKINVMTNRVNTSFEKQNDINDKNHRQFEYIVGDMFSYEIKEARRIASNAGFEEEEFAFYQINPDSGAVVLVNRMQGKNDLYIRVHIDTGVIDDNYTP